ncbi:14876_t:CDS:2 [Cetraspora pellucida]|uniref:14876_t:CDS:1 n=1 Tax=Cetraspora pellucida TaxID=1433469 RepID=A0ACA9N7D4_9GLOM|nr:14876_t:CDS:2 [Cetraspora pellucida]
MQAFLPDKIFEDSEHNSNADTVELINEMGTISLNNESQIELDNTESLQINKKTEKKDENAEHNVLFHQGFVRLLSAFSNNNITPYRLIRLFFSQTILNTILTNTNEYMQSKNAGIAEHSWSSLTLDELKIWLGIIIYMGVIKLLSVTDYWSTDFKYSKYDISQIISMIHFQQIKYYLYISDINSKKLY